MISRRCTKSARVGGSAALATIVTAGLVAIPPERAEAATGIQQVQVQAVILSAATHTSAQEAAAAPTPSTAGAATSPTPHGIAAPLQAIPAASETSENPPSFISIVLGVLDLLVLPFWWLAAPITLPITFIVAVTKFPGEVTDLSTAFILITTAFAFFTGPLGLIDLILKEPFTGATAVKSSAARQARSTPSLEQQSVDQTPSDAANETEVIDAEKPIRGRMTARTSSHAPKSAATTKAPESDSGSTESVGSPTVAEESPRDSQGNEPTSAPAPTTDLDRSSAKSSSRRSAARAS